MEATIVSFNKKKKLCVKYTKKMSNDCSPGTFLNNQVIL